MTESKGILVDLDRVAKTTREWQDRNFPDIVKIDATLALCEEVGEVARAVLKEKLGIRPETRGDVGDEIGDVLLLAIALADRHGLSANDCLMRRGERMLKLDFTKDPEGGR